jgi:alpha-L-rhamnosidase
MTAYYLYKQIYALDGNDNDTMVLDLIRRKFQAMADAPLQCSWEGYSGGSKAHIYGMYPGYFLSAYVLGVRRDAPVAEKKLLIEPHPGNLKKAEGTVVTEFGPVNVSWRQDDAVLRGEITVPDAVSTTLALPRKDGVNGIQVDGKDVPGEVRGKRLCIPLTSGSHAISY